MINSLSNDAVHVLLSPDNQVVFDVPKYQREYSWGKDQWNALFDDLVEQDSNDSHFLGTIICVNKTINATSETVLELIDGQQRLTTISLLLAAIYKVWSDTELDSESDEALDRMSLKRMLVLKTSSAPRLRPQTQNMNFADYEALLSELGVLNSRAVPNWAGNRRIYRAFRHFSKSIEDAAELQGKSSFEFSRGMLTRIKQATMVKLEVSSHADAFTLFESLNNRGMPLTPIDLIKNTLLGKAEKVEGLGVNDAYDKWDSWVSLLGDNPSTQEQFFRYFYNAMKDEYGIAIQGVSVATRKELIRIYELLIDKDLLKLVDYLDSGVRAYSRLSDPESHEKVPELRKWFLRLQRAQGLPGHLLLLYLLLKQDDLGLANKTIESVAKLLVSFFVRRNLTNVPPTSSLVRTFGAIIAEIRNSSEPEVDIEQIVYRRLYAESSSDSMFEEALKGPVYEDNTDLVRFILTSLEEDKMTNETRQDLWKRRGDARQTYVWSIEHILPQGKHLPDEWVAALGGADSAAQLQMENVHRLGNLTITGYNSSLSNRSFVAKRDYIDQRGNSIGYNNGLKLNADVADKDSWGVGEIQTRTKRLVKEVMEAFELKIAN